MNEWTRWAKEQVEGGDLFRSQLNRIRDSKLFCDLKIVAGDKEFHVHKVVLAANSLAFEYILGNEYPNDIVDDVWHIKSFDADIIEIVINFCYTHQAELTEQNCFQVCQASRMYHVDDLCECCSNFLLDHITVENCQDILKLSHEYAIEQLYKKALKFYYSNKRRMRNLRGSKGK